MSTLTSADFGELKRPTTKVHAPPGGGSSWSIGGNNIVAPPTVPSNVAAGRAPPETAAGKVSEEGVPKTKKQLEKSVLGTDQLLRVLIVKTERDANIVNKCAENCLGKMKAAGVAQCEIITVPTLQDIPFASWKMLAQGGFDGIVCVGFLPKSDPMFMVLASSLTKSLMDLSISSGRPIVHGIVMDDVSAANIKVPNGLGSEWAKTVVDLATLGGYGTSLFTTAGSSRMGNSSQSRVVCSRMLSTDCTAVTGGNIIPEKVSTAPIGVQYSLDKVRRSLKKNGACGIIGLGRKFRIIDDDGSKSLCIEEFKKAMAEHTLEMTEEQLQELFNFFDNDGNGTISYDEFLVGLRGELNERRRDLVLKAFAVLDADGSATIELNDIIQKYDADKDPEVISGKKTKNEIFRDFLDTFDCGEKDGKVSPDEFCKYYSNVSASIDDDDYFELMINKAWHISGGEAGCENSTCRRVLVTHSDGRQTVEEIKDDIGMRSDDRNAIQANLSKQGINAKGIELIGSAELKDELSKSPGPILRGRKQVGAGESSIVFG